MADATCYVDRRSLSRLFPSLRLVGVLRLALDFRKLIIAALGLTVLQLGWSLLDWLVPGTTDLTLDLFEASRAASIQPEDVTWTWPAFSAIHSQISEPFRMLADPILVLFMPGSGWLAMLHALLRVLWLIVVWGICGGAICRIAIVQVAQVQQTGVAQALRFSLRRAKTLIAAPLLPLMGVSLCAAIGAGFGLLYRLGDAGRAVAGFLLFMPLFLGLIMTLLAAGLLAGWPLLQAAVAGGAEDALDAFSRVYGYLSQRVGSLVALVALAWLLGMIGTLLVDLLAGGVIRLTLWNLTISGPQARIAPLVGSGGHSDGIAAAMHAFWLGAVKLVAHGWVYSFWWTTAAFLYLWLRHDVDGTPWEEIDPAQAAVFTAAGSNSAVPATSLSPSAPPGSE